MNRILGFSRLTVPTSLTQRSPPRETPTPMALSEARTIKAAEMGPRVTQDITALTEVDHRAEDHRGEDHREEDHRVEDHREEDHREADHREAEDLLLCHQWGA